MGNQHRHRQTSCEMADVERTKRLAHQTVKLIQAYGLRMFALVRTQQDPVPPQRVRRVDKKTEYKNGEKG